MQPLHSADLGKVKVWLPLIENFVSLVKSFLKQDYIVSFG